MVSEAPPFWWKRGADPRPWLLWPFAALYAAAARHRLLTAERHPVAAPVLCIGNLTVGGSGKTPVAITLAREAARMGLSPGIVSRGHGGTAGEPHLVDPDHDSARHVGDEPLLLARAAPTAVTPDRRGGAELLIERGCDFLIMDDGFQSARIHIDFALLVVDARRGIGNGHVVPAGPLRARIVDQMRYADAVLRMGEGDAAEHVVRQAARAGRRIFDARARPIAPPGLIGRRCLAFAGIGDPGKFFATVAEVGASVEIARTFGDHHFYSQYDIDDLLATAEAHDLQLVTTAKDAVRLDRAGPRAEWLRERLRVIDVDARFELAAAPRTIIEATREAWRRRRNGSG